MNRKREDYQPNVQRFFNKYTFDMSHDQARFFWKAFRKAANAYVSFNAEAHRDLDGASGCKDESL